MFCENCGNKLKEGHKFCTKCGHSNAPDEKEGKSFVLSDEKWWYRLAKVVYVLLYAPLLILIPLVWSENAPRYSSYFDEYYGSYGEAFWYSVLTLVIYIVVVRLIKITFLYITLAQKPKWKKEFKKLF
tara:strand:- start:7615 stop:7998 length:384 start_codon:yes stop_codon:yes gene_type:complete